MLDKFIKKYKIKKQRIPQVEELYNITGDPKLSTYLINATKTEPELIDFLIKNYKARAKKSNFKEPGAIIYTMFKTIKLSYALDKQEEGTKIPKEQFDFFLESGAVKIITLTNAVGENLIFEVVKNNSGEINIIYKDTIPELK